MPDAGKVSRAFFAEHVAPNLGAARADVAVGPKHGVDFGVLDTTGEGGGSRGAVLATDPISVLPALGFERAGRFALHIALADVAVSGLAPTHLSIAFSLPPGMSDDEFGAVWRGIHGECEDLGIAVAAGHTARYPGCSYPWVGAATALALGDRDAVVRPDGARPGDVLVVTKGPAVEATGLLASLFPEALDLPAEAVATAQERLAETRLVRDALTVADAGGAHAMHDATEGGLLGALHEFAEAGGVGLDVDRDAVPMRPGVEAFCAAVGMNPWCATSSGTLLAAIAPGSADAVVAALEARDTPAAVVGEVREGSGVVVDGERTTAPTADASWPVYERLASR